MTIDADLRRDQVLAALIDAGPEGRSGQDLAEALGCSRAAVHRHVETLRRQGVTVDGVHEGYRLGPGADPVSATWTERHLTQPIAGPVRWSAETGSTNDDAVAAARTGAAEGLVIGTDLQRTGRGRRGREWHTAPGEALLCSVVLRPPVPAGEAGVLPIVVAAAVAEAIGPEAGIVWPNDIVIGERKVCGILCEVSADESGVAWVVAGIGLNVRGAPSLPDGRWTPGALSDGGDPPPRQELAVRVLTTLGARYAEWLASGPAAALALFAERDLLRGHGVTVIAGAHEVAGTAAGTDEQGHLRVVTAGGEVALGAGEVTRVERG